ncbi:MAG: phosphatidate cytidylyltransferase [Verrucomicrobiota bacterium]
MRDCKREGALSMLKQRIISGLFLAGGFILVATLAHPIVAWLLLIAISSMAQMEFYSIINVAGIPVFRAVGTLCGAALISATYYCAGPGLENIALAYRWEQLVLTAAMMAVFIRQFPQKHNNRPLATVACTLLGIWYVPFLFNFFTRLAFFWDAELDGRTIGTTGIALLIYLVGVVKFTDAAAFFSGKYLGRHKLFPRISPAKTWEGFAGGLAGGVLVSVVILWISGFKLGGIFFGPGHAVICGLLLSVAGVAGDMFESLLKRSSGIKDSGKVVPGMGGFLDILDSLLFGAPVLYAYIVFFLQ